MVFHKGFFHKAQAKFGRRLGVSTSVKSNVPVDELALDPESIRKSFVQQVQYTQGKHPSAATRLDHFISLARVARDRMYDRWTRTWQRRERQQPKVVYYLSLEFLMGRLLDD